ncbi:MAG: isocitrate lyase/PEP mutase family protein [Fervidicoccaceae archaeon]
MGTKTKGRMFREALERPGLLLRPCAYDALSAILIEKAGFEVIGTTGYGIAASLIGQPDIGLVSYGEMLERVRSIIAAVSRPVDVDADTGYGNALNVYWAVYNFALVGAGGIRIEDQVWPKRCGHMAGKQIIPKDEMVQKIKAAIRAKNEIDPELVIGARTDARSVAGFEAVIERGKAYAEAGADYVYVEAPQSIEELKQIVKSIPAPIALNIIPGGRTPPFTLEQLEEAGVKYLSVPMIALYPATKAIMEALKTFKETRDLKKLASMGVSWSEFNEIVGMSRWRAMELEFSTREDLMARYGTDNLEEIMKREQMETEAKWKGSEKGSGKAQQ